MENMTTIKRLQIKSRLAGNMQFAESFLREQCRRIRWLAKKRSKLHITCGRMQEL